MRKEVKKAINAAEEALSTMKNLAGQTTVPELVKKKATEASKDLEAALKTMNSLTNTYVA